MTTPIPAPRHEQAAPPSGRCRRRSVAATAEPVDVAIASVAIVGLGASTDDVTTEIGLGSTWS